MNAEYDRTQTFDIHIRPNGRIHDPDCRKTLKKSNREQVRWIADGGGPWTIVFRSGSPFKRERFEVVADKPIESDVLRENADAKHYKYDVLDKHGKVVDDPDVIVEG